MLQLRLHPQLIALRERLQAAAGASVTRCSSTYITARGRWYDVSWKGDDERSGGIVTNIGIHFFDLLVWLFGPVAQRGSAPARAQARRRARSSSSTPT